MKISAPIMSFLKYIIWTTISAGIFALTGNLDHLSIPVILIPVVAAMLKGLATAIQFNIDKNKPE